MTAPGRARRPTRRVRPLRSCPMRRPAPGPGRGAWPVAAVLALLGALVATVPIGRGSARRAPRNRPPASAVADPAALVHPLDGTGTGPVSPGTVGEFPGADVPFGMIQWSPDTSPNAVQSGGGYAYADSTINGFSLTHLSGTGCPSYQDVPILPDRRRRRHRTPRRHRATFSHSHEEHASPGRYQVELGPAPIAVSLAVTTRTGISSFDFPSGTTSNVLFKVAGSVNPVTAAGVARRGPRRGRGAGDERSVLSDGDQLHPALRGPLRPALLLGRHLGQLGRLRREHGLHGALVRRLRHVRHDDPTAGPHEGRHLLRQHERRGAEPPGRGPGVVGPAGGHGGTGALGRPSRAHRRARRHDGPAAHLLHGAVPLTPLPQRRVGRQRQTTPAATGRCTRIADGTSTPTSPSGTSTAARRSSSPSSPA